MKLLKLIIILYYDLQKRLEFGLSANFYKQIIKKSCECKFLPLLSFIGKDLQRYNALSQYSKILVFQFLSTCFNNQQLC